MEMKVFDKFVLPNGSSIPNRIAQAAMAENMADADHAPSEQLMRLYQAWAEGEAGLLITGNVMIDSSAMTGPGGVVLEDDRHLEKFRRWAGIGRAKAAQFWLQINHPGRQMPANLGQKTWAPSEGAMDLGTMSKHLNANPKFLAAEAEVDSAALAPLPNSQKIYDQSTRSTYAACACRHAITLSGARSSPLGQVTLPPTMRACAK